MALNMTVPTMEDYGWEGLSEALMSYKGYTWLYEMRRFECLVGARKEGKVGKGGGGWEGREIVI